MKLRTQLLLLAALVVAVLGLTLAQFASIAAVAASVQKRQQVANELVVGAFQLDGLLAEYMQHPSPRVEEQWQRRHASLQQSLQQVENMVAPINRSLHAAIRDDLAEMSKQFGLLRANARPAGDAALDAAQRGQQATRMRIKSSVLVTDALHWSKVLNGLEAELQERLRWTLGGTGLALAVVVGLMLLQLLLGVLRPLRNLKSGIDTVSAGRLDHRIALPPGNELGEIAAAFNQMTGNLLESEASIRDKAAQLERENWLRAALVALHVRMQGDPAMAELADAVLAGLAESTGAQVGAFLLADDGRLRLVGRYAYRSHADVPESFALGEGLVGQAAASGQVMLLTDLPGDYLLVGSALGQMPPHQVLALPIRFGGSVNAVIELAIQQALDDRQRQFLDLAAPAIGIAVQMARARDSLQVLLAKTQQQAEELQVQQEELRVSNEELEEQTARLKISEERLKAQQEELEVSNEELEEKNELLERQKREVEQARRELSVKADELALASKYKSEFLANMSHELRTPLNSLLLLAHSLTQNQEGNLTADQIECARVIHGSGSDLLNLINEILDLSKIEAGRMELQLGVVSIEELSAGLHATFNHMARNKGLAFETVVDAGIPAEITTDRKRLEQILRNLMSNALKFTERGGIKVTFARPAAETRLHRSGLAADKTLAIAVRDSGIGISADKHKLIFEAFQQADGTTTRRFGGTGLGLTISRELAILLDGEIQIESTPGEGSTFTLYVPWQATGKAPPARKPQVPPAELPAWPAPAAPLPAEAPAIEDDRSTLAPGDQAILVIEDDPRFAALLRSQCHAKNLKCLAAASGEAGLELVRQHPPAAVILDLCLPGMDGWAVLAALKGDTRTRHIPVHVVSGIEGSGESLRRGAVGHALKPLDPEGLEALFRKLAEVGSPRPKRVLVVEDDPVIRRSTIDVIGSSDVSIDIAATGAEALQALRAGRYDCIVLDLRLPDMDGRVLLARLAGEGVMLPPVVVHTAAELSPEEEAALREQAETIVVKDGRSPERLLDEVSLFLHRIVSQMPERQQKIIHDLYDTDARLRNKKVLVVDDDMRTTFAVARLLADHGMQPLKAGDGAQCLKLLEAHPDIAIVLMDIMMPVMDGYEAMRSIRAQERFKNLPIIALTAKAMPEDRQKCLAAGASDYASKPVDPARLFSLMRVWLYR